SPRLKGLRLGTAATTIIIMLRFTKMNGAGNDFVLIDNRSGDVHLDRNQIVQICDRHRGIGGDGILLLEKASNQADFRMRYFNSDGARQKCAATARAALHVLRTRSRTRRGKSLLKRRLA